MVPKSYLLLLFTILESYDHLQKLSSLPLACARAHGHIYIHIYIYIYVYTHKYQKLPISCPRSRYLNHRKGLVPGCYLEGQNVDEAAVRVGVGTRCVEIADKVPVVAAHGAHGAHFFQTIIFVFHTIVFSNNQHGRSPWHTLRSEPAPAGTRQF
jgi:hypothetical protein